MAMKKQELNYIMNKIRVFKSGPCLFSGRAQAAFEYAIILAIVVTALISMQVYFKRGIQAGVKMCSDELGGGELAGDGLGGQREGLFEIDIEHNIIPQESAQTSTRDIEHAEVIEKGEKRNLTIDESTTRSGTMVSAPFGLRRYAAVADNQQPDSEEEEESESEADETDEDEEESSGGWMEYCMGEGYSASDCADAVGCIAHGGSIGTCMDASYGYDDYDEWW